MAKAKDFHQIIDEIKKDSEKINKKFNKKIADEFKEQYKIEADKWYSENSPVSDYYERRFQLKNKALIITKIEDYGEKVSFSHENIRPKKGKKPKKIKAEDGSIILDRSGTLPSYYNSKDENISSSVLAWEEAGIHNFAKYGYGKGDGIWGKTLKEMISKIDSIKLDNIKFNAPEDIMNDLFNLLKEQTKKIMQERYNEMFF